MPKEPEERVESQSPLQKSQEALLQLDGVFNRFVTTVISPLSQGEAFDQQLANKVMATFTTATVDSVGVRSDKAHVVYGDWIPSGNMEGSLYTRFEGNTLRIRWAGDWAMYFNDHYMRIKKDEGTRYRLQPGRIEGRKVVDITQRGIETEDPMTFPAYEEAFWNYQVRLAQENSLRGMAQGLKRRIFSQPTEPLVAPLQPEPLIIPHERFQGIVEEIRDGLERTMYTINQVRGNSTSK